MAKNVEIVVRFRLAMSEGTGTIDGEQSLDTIAEDVRAHLDGLETFWTGPRYDCGYDIESVEVASTSVKRKSYREEQRDV